MTVALLVEEGGWRRMWEEVVPALDAAGVDVLAGSVFPRGPVHDEWERLGWESFTLDSRTSRDYPRAALRLRRLLRRRGIRLVHATETIPAFVAGLATVGSSRRLSIFHRQHCDWDDKPRMSMLSRMASRLTDCTLACSETSAQSAHDLDGVPWERIRIAHNGANRLRAVSEQELESTRRRCGAEADSAIVVCVAHLRPEKGLDVALHALPLVRDGLDRPLRCVVVGDGACRAELEALAKAEDLPVHFAGHQDEIAPWYAIADVVAMPSRREPFGVVAAEAMSAGKPLVASRVQGLTEIVEDGESGILVAPDDPVALADAIGYLLGDEDERARFGVAAEARFERLFTNQAMVAAWLKCWSELVGTQQRDAVSVVSGESP